MRESGGNYCRRNERGSTACGAYQFVRGTWNGYWGYPDACSAPPDVQDAKAEEVWAGGRGCGHWGRAACG
jgi:muramidase (phage lysozyme)